MKRFFLEKTEAWDVLETMLNEAGRADEITVCSFAMAESFIRRLIKQRPRIGKITVILDFVVATRNRSNMLFIAKNTDELYLCNTHAKLILVESENYKMVCTLSANATMNHRYECGMMSGDPQIINQAKECLAKMKADGQRIKFD